MQKITIANIESKTGTSDKGAWTKVTITGADGLKASGFDPGLANLKPGNVIEAEIETKGKFVNIAKFSVISQGQPPETKPIIPPQNGKSYGKSLEVVALEEAGRDRREQVQRASIEKQVALKELGEMIRAGKADDMMLLWNAAIWDMIRIGDPHIVITPQILGNPPFVQESPREEPAIPDFKSPGEFANWWMKHGFPWIDIQGVLGIKTPADIKDLKAASETLAKIKAAREAKSLEKNQ